MATEFMSLPLVKLVAASNGVRVVKSKEAFAELLASIRANGLQQNLVVMKDGKRFQVVAGNRRLAALQQLQKEGHLDADYAVPCRVEETLDAARIAEISLLENAVREDMHPADLFEAFRGLVDHGQSTADIAARFGRSEGNVQRLLRLARVSPKVLKAYRGGNLNLEQVQAFAITEDQPAQERVLENLEDWDGPGEIRGALTEGEIPASDMRVQYVGLEAYEKAGGKVHRNLFAEVDPDPDDDDGDTPEGAYIEDAALLDKLVLEKLQHTLDSVMGDEGWKWGEVRVEFDYSERSQFQRLHAEPPLMRCKRNWMPSRRRRRRRMRMRRQPSRSAWIPSRISSTRSRPPRKPRPNGRPSSWRAPAWWWPWATTARRTSTGAW